MVTVKKMAYENIWERLPGKGEIGTWIFRIGEEVVWMMDCLYEDAEKRARKKARSCKVKVIYLLP